MQRLIRGSLFAQHQQACPQQILEAGLYKSATCPVFLSFALSAVYECVPREMGLCRGHWQGSLPHAHKLLNLYQDRSIDILLGKNIQKWF